MLMFFVIPEKAALAQEKASRYLLEGLSSAPRQLSGSRSLALPQLFPGTVFSALGSRGRSETETVSVISVDWNIRNSEPRLRGVEPISDACHVGLVGAPGTVPARRYQNDFILLFFCLPSP